MNYVKLIAPAKVNLVLAVGAQRSDGYHAVNTIMHSLALHDTLTMRRFEEDEGGCDIQLKCESTEGVEMTLEPQDNLVYRAISALAQALGRKESEQIVVTLKKTIPMQAGLGGGSSDAAAALIGAATLWDVPLTDERITQVAQALGSDVAFFLHGGCAYLSGRGDVFEHALTPQKGFCVLIRPEGEGVSTAQAYQTFDENPCFATSEEQAAWTQATKAEDISCWNNMSAAAYTLKPELKSIYEWARAQEGVSDVVLCGSGAATLAVADSYDTCTNLSVACRKQGWLARVTSFAPVGASIVESF